MKEKNKLLLINCEKAQKLAMQFESAHNLNLGLTSPIENEVTQDFENILNQENVFENSMDTDLEEVRTVIKKNQKHESP